METITWKYVKPLSRSTAVDEFEGLHGVVFPDDLKKVLVANNGGRPSLRYYDLPYDKDREFKTLLSFNEEDKETIYKRYPVDSEDKSLLPFASDSAGNLFVIKDGGIWLWNHENDSTVFVASSFAAFMGLLHE